MRSLDTDPWAEEMQLEILRKMTPQRRLDLTFQLSATTWNSVRAAVDRLHPEETEDQRDQRFFSSIYGEELAAKFIAYRQKKLGPRNGTLK
ncbi:MAG TPA: hypothetical protein VGP72_16080 [Planctomycetota bacterium]|jgi:hypothetical protein